MCGCDVECRIASREAIRDLDPVPLLDRDLLAASELEVDRRGRSDDVEGNPVVRRKHCQSVGADLVRGIPVAGDSVSARQDAVDLADPGFWDTGLDLIDDQLRAAEDAAREARDISV